MLTRQQIKEHFESLSNLYAQLDDFNRATSFKTSLDSIMFNCQLENFSEKDILNLIKLPRVGKSSVDELIELNKIGDNTKRKIELQEDLKIMKSEQAENIDTSELESLLKEFKFGVKGNENS